MPDHQNHRKPWVEPPLFEPDWILLRLHLNVQRGTGDMWGGLEVTDGLSDTCLMSTAQAFSEGLEGLVAGVQQLVALAAAHLEAGAPFPT